MSGAICSALSPFALAAVVAAIDPACSLGLAGLALLAVAAAARWLAWQRTGFALDGDRLLIRSGWWRRRTVLLPIANVQSVDLTENAVGRRFGIAGARFRRRRRQRLFGAWRPGPAARKGAQRCGPSC